MAKSKPTGKVYEIKALTDFADIPEDRIEACLADFSIFVAMVRSVKASYDATKAAGLTEFMVSGGGFTWTDDGEVKGKGGCITVTTRHRLDG